MRHFGLIGYPLGHSFSQRWFGEKFAREGIDAQYTNLEIPRLTEIVQLGETFEGVNVTIPYKRSVIPFLSALSPEAAQIGAVNCIRFDRPHGRSIGYNTDVVGFDRAIRPLLTTSHEPLCALVLGVTGGAAQAICYALKMNDISYVGVSRSAVGGDLSYSDLTPELIRHHRLIINCTPVGTFPENDRKPMLPYDALTSDHRLFDLVYNPSLTAFLREGLLRGAVVRNGYAMLVEQAEESWKIWNKP